MKKTILSVFAIIMLHAQSGISMESPEPSKAQLDALYEQAIAYRNAGETENAAEIFLQLSYRGNPKAMHNYAMLKYNNKEYDQAFQWFSIAAELGLSSSKKNIAQMKIKRHLPENARVMEDDKKIDLYLVVGSNREGHNLGPVFRMLNESQSSDLSHKNSFDQRTTTMDKNPCKEANVQHIVGDARTFSFNKYNIKSVYLERLPTFPEMSEISNSSNFDEIFTRKNNIIGNIIDNVALAMEPGALLEIELQPYTTTIPDMTADMREHCWRTNPFHGVFDLRKYVSLPKKVGAAQTRAQSEEMVSTKDKISSLIDLYVQQGVHIELKKMYKLPQISDYDLIKVRFLDEFRQITILTKDNLAENTDKITNIMENSILGALMADLSVMNSIPHIKKYLELNGFGNVTIQRTTSPRNGRKNVWLVTATKS